MWNKNKINSSKKYIVCGFSFFTGNGLGYYHKKDKFLNGFNLWPDEDFLLTEKDVVKLSKSGWASQIGVYQIIWVDDETIKMAEDFPTPILKVVKHNNVVLPKYKPKEFRSADEWGEEGTKMWNEAMTPFSNEEG